MLCSVVATPLVTPLAGKLGVIIKMAAELQVAAPNDGKDGYQEEQVVAAQLSDRGLLHINGEHSCP